AKYGVNQKQLFSFAGPTVFYVAMNTSQPLFKNNPKLRRAVNYAIDRTKLAEVVGPLPYAGAVTDDYLPTVMPGYVDAHLYPLALTILPHSVEYVDPSQFLDLLLDGRTIRPTENTNLAYFDSPRYNRLIERASRLSGNARYDAYGKLAVDIARDAAPLAAFHN